MNYDAERTVTREDFDTVIEGLRSVLAQATCVVDPARYSDRARAVIEMPDGTDFDEGELEAIRQQVGEFLGMPVLMVYGFRLARIEEP